MDGCVMETRDIFDYLGAVIGTLTMPDGTTEEQWQQALAPYASAPVTIIPDVTPRQMRQALILVGLPIANVEAALLALPEPYKSLATIEWEYSVAFQRNRPLVAQIAQALGWSTQQLDDLWTLAASL